MFFYCLVLTYFRFGGIFLLFFSFLFFFCCLFFTFLVGQCLMVFSYLVFHTFQVRQCFSNALFSHVSSWVVGIDVLWRPPPPPHPPTDQGRQSNFERTALCTYYFQNTCCLGVIPVVWVWYLLSRCVTCFLRE